MHLDMKVVQGHGRTASYIVIDSKRTWGLLAASGLIAWLVKGNGIGLGPVNLMDIEIMSVKLERCSEGNPFICYILGLRRVPQPSHCPPNFLFWGHRRLL
jgi:hypothetical protein